MNITEIREKSIQDREFVETINLNDNLRNIVEQFNILDGKIDQYFQESQHYLGVSLITLSTSKLVEYYNLDEDSELAYTVSYKYINSFQNRLFDQINHILTDQNHTNIETEHIIQIARNTITIRNNINSIKDLHDSIDRSYTNAALQLYEKVPLNQWTGEDLHFWANRLYDSSRQSWKLFSDLMGRDKSDLEPEKWETYRIIASNAIAYSKRFLNVFNDPNILFDISDIYTGEQEDTSVSQNIYMRILNGITSQLEIAHKYTEAVLIKDNNIFNRPDLISTAYDIQEQIPSTIQQILSETKGWDLTPPEAHIHLLYIQYLSLLQHDPTWAKETKEKIVQFVDQYKSNSNSTSLKIEEIYKKLTS